MTTEIRRRLAEDSGMSLVEMMVAILILGVVLSAFASTLTTSLISLSRDESRVRATHVANQVAEDLRAEDWDALGFYADDPSFTSSYTDSAGTHDTVELGPSRAGAPGPQPGPQTTTVDGIVYTTTTDVYWLDDEMDGLGAADADSNLHDVKAFHVVVEWTSRGRDYQLVTDGIRPPTIDEVPAVAPSAAPTVAPGTFAVATYEVMPTAVTISPSGTTQQEIVVTLTTTMPAIVPNLAYNSVSIGMQEVVGSGGTQWTHTIATGNSTFYPGTYDFVVTATGAGGGSDTATAVVAFSQPSVTAVQVLEPIPGPGSHTFCTSTNGTLPAPVTLQIDVLGLSGTDVDDEVTVSWNAQPGSTTATLQGSSPTGGTRWSAVIPQGHKFNKSVTTVTVRAVRAVDGTTATESFVYNVGGGC